MQAIILAAGMGNELSAEYEQVKGERPFYGVYYGQSGQATGRVDPKQHEMYGQGT